MSKKWWGILVLGVALSARSEAEKGATTNAPPEKPSLGDLIIDPEDGALDLSAFLATAKGFLPIGSIITEPAVGYGAALGVLFFHDSIENRAEEAKKRSPDGTLQRLPPPSITGVVGMATENGTWGAGLFHLGIWKEDRIRYLGGLGYVSANLEYWLPGDQPNFPDSVDYTLEGVFLLQQATFRMKESDFFLGANYQYMSFDSVLDAGMIPQDLPPLQQTVQSGGVGGVLQYDCRNNIFTPDSGTDAKVEMVFYDELFGGDRSFQKVNTYLHHWIPVAKPLVLGLRADGQFSASGTPFYMLPYVSLRGIPAQRYAGRHALMTEAELRWDLSKRWSLVGFAGAGWTAQDELSDFGHSDTHVAGGFGFRYLLAQVFGVRSGFDFAWSEEDFAFYITSGSAW